MTRTRKKRTKKNPSFQTTTPNHKYGLVPVNSLTYGNPNALQSLLVEKVGPFDSLANHFMKKPYPDNDGKYAQNELVKITESMKKLEHEKIISMCLGFDEDLKGMCEDMANKCGMENSQQFVKSVFDDIGTIIMKLKFFYNRIRPYQLANIYQYPLNPMPTTSAQSPSYPSGHTIQSKVIADILTFKYPDQSSPLEKFAEKCSESRLILGVHYPSDSVFGLQIASVIGKDEGFRQKYYNQKVLSSENNHLDAYPEQPPQQPQPGSHPHHPMRPNDRGPQNKGPFNNSLGKTQNLGAGDESGVFGGLPTQPPPIDHHLKDDEVFGGLPRQPQNG
jgi:hypothetical protein